MPKTYTLVAYRPNGYDDRKRTSSSSKLEISSHSDVAELVGAAGGMAFDNELARRRDHALRSFEFALLIDGLDREASWDLEHSEEFDEIHEAIGVETDRLRVIHEQQERDAEARRRVEAIQAIQATEQAVRDQEIREKELLRDLIAKHGIPVTEGDADAQ